jgi:hypothetical protein
MHDPGKTRSKLTVAALFFAASGSILYELSFFRSLFYSLTPGSLLVDVALLASPFAFLGAGVLVFLRSRLAYGLALGAGLMALPWFVRIERMGDMSSWAIFNLPFESWSSFYIFILVSVGLIVIGMAGAVLRLLPAELLIGRSPLCQSTWPAFAVGVLAMGGWFVHGAIPYQVPGFSDGVLPRLQILHVEKHGLHFHETRVSGFRNGQFWISRSDRSLFQYRFETRIARGVMPYEQVSAFNAAPEFRDLHTQTARLLRAWNAEGWYVVLQNSQLFAFSSEYQTSPPQLVKDLLDETEKLPAAELRPVEVRDVCLGFCYGPLAALGYKYGSNRGPR